MATDASEAETFWTDFLRSLARRGLRGVKLAISGAHVGLDPTISLSAVAAWTGKPALLGLPRPTLPHHLLGHDRRPRPGFAPDS